MKYLINPAQIYRVIRDKYGIPEEQARVILYFYYNTGHHTNKEMMDDMFVHQFALNEQKSLIAARKALIEENCLTVNTKGKEHTFAFVPEGEKKVRLIQEAILSIQYNTTLV